MLNQDLIGAHVKLTAFTEANLTQDYLSWLNDRQLMKFSNQRFRTHSMESCRAYLATFVGSDHMLIAIYFKGEFVGTMTAYRSVVHSTCDIGLLVCSTVQGKGVGKDAWGTLMAHLLASGTRKVTGGALSCNYAMVHIMKCCGMHSDGVRARHEMVEGVPHDVLYFAKFNSP